MPEGHLPTLLRRMAPRLNPGEWVFTRCAAMPADVDPAVTVREDEGLTVVLQRADADRLGLDYDFVAAWITLTVDSSLDAVGLTAAFSGVLADAGISANVIAGFTHDHLFVPVGRAEDAMRTLRRLADRPSLGPCSR